MKPVIIITLAFVLLIPLPIFAQEQSEPEEREFRIMEYWLSFIVFGLFLDILGIWILAGPLLKIVFKNREGWNKRVQLAKDAYEKEKKNLEGRKEGEMKSTDWIVTGVHFTRLEAYLYRVLDFLYKDRHEQRRLAYIGLFIITIGFVLQIIGNILQSFEI